VRKRKTAQWTAQSKAANSRQQSATAPKPPPPVEIASVLADQLQIAREQLTATLKQNELIVQQNQLVQDQVNLLHRKVDDLTALLKSNSEQLAASKEKEGRMRIAAWTMGVIAFLSMVIPIVIEIVKGQAKPPIEPIGMRKGVAETPKPKLEFTR
jgi:hypothetical protein